MLLYFPKGHQKHWLMTSSTFLKIPLKGIGGQGHIYKKKYIGVSGGEIKENSVVWCTLENYMSNSGRPILIIQMIGY